MDGNTLDANVALSRLKPLDLSGGLLGGGKADQGNGAGDLLAGFGNVLRQEMAHITDLQQQADAAVNTYAVGGPIEMHNVVLAVEKADMALQLAVQVRNRMIAAYQEISRMQV